MLTLDPNDENIILGIPEDRDHKEEPEPTTKKEKVNDDSKLVGITILTDSARSKKIHQPQGDINTYGHPRAGVSIFLAAYLNTPTIHPTYT